VAGFEAASEHVTKFAGRKHLILCGLVVNGCGGYLKMSKPNPCKRPEFIIVEEVISGE
jgi:hypothetical protein